jgi:hypothetical protein
MIRATTCACHRLGRPSSSSLSLQWSAEKGSSRSMGHQHLGTLPQSKKWQRVVGLISGGADVRDVASAVSAAAERAMIDAANDPAVRSAFYLLTQVLLAARKEHFVPELRMLGLRVSSQPSLVEIVSAFTQAVDREVRANGGRTDFSEMVQLAATESLNAVAGRELSRLFGTTTNDVKTALADLATVKQFGLLSCDFFSRLTRRHLDYYLSRELPKHVGINSRFQTVREHKQFDEAVETHCRETARIVKEFSGEWFSKHTYEGGITQAKAGGFVHVAFEKIRKEMRIRRNADG